MMSEVARELDEQAVDMGFADRFEAEAHGYVAKYDIKDNGLECWYERV